MGRILEMLLACIVVSIFLIPVIIALVLATFAASLFSALLSPVTEPIHGILGAVSDRLPNPLESIPMFPAIKRYFGSSKNILFIGFVIVYLVFHYQSLSDVGNILDNISLLFPGSALDQVISYGSYNGKLDIASFFVNPERYLQTLIISFITGLFMHIGCTTKDPCAHVHFLVKLLYTMLISLFASIVLGKIPADAFSITIPEFSLDLSSAGTVAGDTDAQMMLAQLQEWGRILLDHLVSIVPVLVAVYFLVHSISGFAAAFLGGFLALAAVGIGWPDAFSDPDSFQSVFLLLFILATGEVVALIFSEFISEATQAWVSLNREVLTYYNVISLLISYFFYPTLGLSVLGFISLIVNGFDFAVLALSLVCLLVFSLATLAGYKITQWTSWRYGHVDGGTYAVAMVINIPIWIIYLISFAM